jgi:hypothetical protein
MVLSLNYGVVPLYFLQSPCAVYSMPEQLRKFAGLGSGPEIAMTSSYWPATHRLRNSSKYFVNSRWSIPDFGASGKTM